MRYSSGYRASFNAGRRYSVHVLWDREGFADTDHDEWVRIAKLIDGLVSELRDRDLTKMLGPHHPSAFGIASFFMERLALHAPVKKVSVREYDGPCASVEANPER